MKRIGIYGGTFNPPHLGHIRAAAFGAEALRLDRMLLIPDKIAPHKDIPDGSPTPDQRLQMLCLAAQGNPALEVSDMELRREGKSYTWETVAQLRKENPKAKLFLCMGTDMFLSFLSWKEAHRILREVTLAVFCRGDKGEKKEIEAQKQKLERMDGRVVLVENPVTAISSTQLRRMLVFRCADSFLPAGVGDYIRANGLYGTGRDFQNLPEAELERVVVSLLSPDRVAHVLGCRDKAVELAKRWGADQTDAARAGLLHDITKALDGPLQLTLCREYGIILDNFSSENPKTLHALTGSLVAERIFGENQAVVDAIRSHTTGKANMNLLEKIIYVADYTERNRDFPNVDELRHLADTDMDEAMRWGLENTLNLLRKQGRDISPASQEALAYLQDNRN